MNTQLKVEFIKPTFLFQRLAVRLLIYYVITDTLILYLIQQYSSHYSLIFIISYTRQELNDSELLLLLLLLALQPTMGFSLLNDSPPFRPLFTQLSPPFYS
jgi:hypothetical protein